MTLSEFFFDIPIYEKIEITDDKKQTLKHIADYYGSPDFEGYNPWLKIESTFKVQTDLERDGANFVTKGGYGIVNIKCKRGDSIFTYYVHYNATTKILMKIGQYPTVADFHISEIKQYSKLLPNEKLKEFTRAIGLAANGVGIGSFVYLRRIFENLIMEAFEIAKKDDVVSEEEFKKARMDKKIDLLNSYLPSFLVENKSMYSILSLGIHELDEQTCLANFDTLRVGIEIILDEKLDEFRKKEKIKQAKQKLSALKNEIK
ncbi:hypothetical protein [Flavobacterium sp.]|uniref:hypothetical protein n=1 Tax=Flavobacterium sp. TaxID=239 RepID=UPI0031D87765